MKKSKCKTCRFYDQFFNCCIFYYKEVYLGEGDYDIQPVNIRYIKDEECVYEPI